jgi:hypothetical protein
MTLADDTLPEVSFERQNRADFIFHHFPDRNARPGGDDLRHNLLVNADADKRHFALQRSKPGVSVSESAFQAGRFRIYRFTGGVAFFQLEPNVANLSDELSFGFPAFLERC